MIRAWWTSGLVAVAMLASAAAWPATVPFNTSYLGSNGNATCGTTYAMAGREPDDDDTHPVFLYMVGTTELYNNGQALAAVKAMAERGFVAATIKYQSGSFGLCADIARKAACIFKPGSARSAVSKLCARPRASCAKGIVVAGFSQGAVIATLAKNTDTRVTAAYGMGALRQYGIYDMSSCMSNGKHKLPARNLRIVNGEKDAFAGGTAAAVRASSANVAGRSCGASAWSCLNADGSGWVIVRNSQVKDKSADHCYQRASGDCTGNPNTVDANWKSGTAPWSLPANLDWLKTFTVP